MKKQELAWAAGFFDGEGCTRLLGQTNKYPVISLKVSQVDPRPLLRFHTAVNGLGHLYGPYNQKSNRSKPYYEWSASGKYAIQAMNLLWTFLSEPKQEQWLKCKTEIEKRKTYL